MTHPASVRCAVFGANGYLGSHLAYLLQRQGQAVQAYDVQSAPVLVGVPYASLDVTREDAWRAFDPHVDRVYFFTGLTGTFDGFAQAQRFLKVNEGGLLFLLEKLRESGSHAKVVFPSTRLVYRGSEQPLAEDAEKEAKSIYAVNKLACENYLSAYHGSFGQEYAVFRVCVPYGSLLKMDASYGTVGFFLRTAQAGKTITLYGDGSQRRTLTHVEDICEQIISVSSLPEVRAGTFNIGGESFALSELATLIARKFGVDVEYREWPEADLRLESGTTLFDDTLIRRTLGYVRRHAFVSWLEQI